MTVPEWPLGEIDSLLILPITDVDGHIESQRCTTPPITLTAADLPSPFSLEIVDDEIVLTSAQDDGLQASTIGLEGIYQATLEIDLSRASTYTETFEVVIAPYAPLCNF